MLGQLGKKIINYLTLFILNLKYKLDSFLGYLKTIFNYYSNPVFAKIDSYLIFSYLFDNPFSISKRFLMSRNEEDVYTFGETPLTTLDEIAKNCRIDSKDVVFELGCGRGRTCFWLNQFIGCSVIGVDYVPEFIQRANQVKTKFNIKEVQFRLEDILKTDFTGATVIYLYGTCFSDKFIKTLITHFKSLPKGTKIITVSYPLSEYTKEPLFEVYKRFSATFNWGEGDVYLQIKL